MNSAPEWAPVEALYAAEYSPVKYSGLSSRRPGFESRPEHQVVLLRGTTPFRRNESDARNVEAIQRRQNEDGRLARPSSRTGALSVPRRKAYGGSAQPKDCCFRDGEQGYLRLPVGGSGRRLGVYQEVSEAQPTEEEETLQAKS